jgi:hypothetical protein
MPSFSSQSDICCVAGASEQFRRRPLSSLAWTQGQRRVAIVRSGDSVRGVGDHWILKNNPMQSSRTYPILSDASVVLEDRTQITSEQVVQHRSRGPITKNQVAALLKDFEVRPVVVHPTKASGSLAARLHGGAIRGLVRAFLATRAEHPNTQAWGRRKDVKVFGCSDDCARSGTGEG